MQNISIEELIKGESVKTILTENFSVAQVVSEFSHFKSPSIVSFFYETKKYVARVSASVGFSTYNMYKSDVDILNKLLLNESDDLTIKAITDLKESLEKSLEVGIGNHPSYSNKDKMIYVDGKNSPLKVHKDTGKVYFKALSLRKIILVQKMEEKPTKSSDLVKEKNRIREEHMKSERYRQFILDTENIHSITFKKNEIVFNSFMTDKLTEIVQDLKRPLTLEEYEEFLKNWK
jgi:hypothetical protein